MTGNIIGHDVSGDAIIRNQFGTEQHVSFDDVRLVDPFDRAKPNWHHLPSRGRLLKPDPETIGLFQRSMERVIPPGPTYGDLAREIWGRGFEIYLVGGTVRDILAGQVANDIDFVTTMPLNRMVGFLQSMFLTRSSGYGKAGYIRLGGSPESGDPFIDLKVFSDSLPRSENATFGVGFDRDVGFRDFTCNAVYYDPINEVIVDPTGAGVGDCENARLRLVEGHHDRHQMGQVFIRGVKFVSRGFVLVSETRETLVSEYMRGVGAMKRQLRVRYFRTQVMSKHRGTEAQMEAVVKFKASLAEMGCPTAWDEFFDFDDEELRGG